MRTERQPGWRLAAFAAPAVPLSAMLLPLTIYLPNYYSKELGVNLASVGSAAILIRLFDLGFDPAFGSLVDRVRTPWGRFRPWVLIGCPIAMLAIYNLFMAQIGVGAMYLTLWLIVVGIGQSMSQLSMLAWASQVATEYHERSRIYGWWQALTVIGMLAILTLPVIVGRLGGSDAAGVHAMGWFIIGALPVTIGLALLVMREPTANAERQRIDWRHYWIMIREPAMVRVLLTDIVIGTAPTVAGTLLFYYFESVRGYGRPETAGMLLFYFLGALAGAPIWTWLARRIGKHRALMVAGLFYAVVQIGVLLSPSGAIVGMVVMFVAGLPFSAGGILLRAMMADVADVVRLRTGVDLSGMLFSLLTGSIKIGTTIAVGGTFYILAGVGFDPKTGAENSKLALDTLSGLFALLPAGLGVLAAWLISGHKLDQAAHALVRAELDALADGNAVPVEGAAPAFVRTSPTDVAEDPPVRPA
ncbi:MAG TPA: MFS transporter [Caulobacter sp.]|nr:MFS transporter [Caulobacter sp.]